MASQVGDQRRPTMADVARAAGVSLTTVSRVINNVPTVDPDLAERVLTAAGALGFRRNNMARSLRNGRTSASIGLIIEDLANPFYSTITAAVASTAYDHDALLLTASSEEDPGRERDLILAMCERRVDGLLVVPTGLDHSFLGAELQMGTRAVFLDRPPSGIRADTVVIDNAAGTRQVMAHLLARGHRRIGLLADSLTIATMRERLAAAETALEEAAVPHDPALVRHDLHDPGITRAAVAGMLDLADPPSALFCANNRITLGAVEEVWSRDAEVEIVGFDDFEGSAMLPLPLTLVSYDVGELGRTGAELLFRRIDGDSSRPATVVIPTHLERRGTPRR